MEMKLRQGVGRLIRSERDSGVVAILDQRAACKAKGVTKAEVKREALNKYFE